MYGIFLKKTYGICVPDVTEFFISTTKIKLLFCCITSEKDLRGLQNVNF